MATSATKPQTLVELRADLEAKEAEFRHQQQMVEVAAARADERRQAALREFDKRIVDDFDQDALDRAVEDADRFLTEAIIAGDWTEIRAAFVAVNRTRELRRSVTDRTKAAYQALGVELHTVGLNGPTSVGMVDLFERIEETLKREAARQAADREDSVAQARIDAGESAATGK